MNDEQIDLIERLIAKKIVAASCPNDRPRQARLWSEIEDIKDALRQSGDPQ